MVNSFKLTNKCDKTHQLCYILESRNLQRICSLNFNFLLEAVKSKLENSDIERFPIYTIISSTFTNVYAPSQTTQKYARLFKLYKNYKDENSTKFHNSCSCFSEGKRLVKKIEMKKNTA